MTVAVQSRSVWKDMYTAALFESDRAKMLQRIVAAENEIVKRARMLSEVPQDHSDEAEALDDALYMLRALKSCLKLQTMERIAA
jgi:DNA-binding winged helix-turn-helix (wHTH) protein